MTPCLGICDNHHLPKILTVEKILLDSSLLFFDHSMGEERCYLAVPLNKVDFIVWLKFCLCCVIPVLATLHQYEQTIGTLLLLSFEFCWLVFSCVYSKVIER